MNSLKFPSMENSEEKEQSVITATLDLKIHNFSTAIQEVCEYQCINYKDSQVLFSVKVFPNSGEQDCLLFRVRAIVSNDTRYEEWLDHKWVVSIIDIEGTPRFTQYYDYERRVSVLREKDELTNENLSLTQIFNEDSPIGFAEECYLEKSFILERSDELLSDGTLFLRCIIYLKTTAIYREQYPGGDVIIHKEFTKFKQSIPQAVLFKNGSETENSTESFTVFDFTGQVLTLPQFHEARKRFGVYGISPGVATPISESEEDIRNILENVWMFDTHTDRFLLSLAQGNLGRLLFDASLVIRYCVTAPFREHFEKHIKLPIVDSLIFLIVLHFLKSGGIFHFSFTFEIAVEIYKFSHMYDIKNLMQTCAQYLTRIPGFETELDDEDLRMYIPGTKKDLKELKRITEVYVDDVYLFELLQSRKSEIFKRWNSCGKVYRPHFEFYKQYII